MEQYIPIDGCLPKARLEKIRNQVNLEESIAFPTIYIDFVLLHETSKTLQTLGCIDCFHVVD